jgi:hypothetical protein
MHVTLSCILDMSQYIVPVLLMCEDYFCTHYFQSSVVRAHRDHRLRDIARGSIRSTRGLGPTMTARGQSIDISIGMLPQTLIMSITVQKTFKYYTTVFDLEVGF